MVDSAGDVLRRVYLEQPYSPDHVDRASKALLHTRSTLYKVVTRAFKDDRLAYGVYELPVDW